MGIDPPLTVLAMLWEVGVVLVYRAILLLIMLLISLAPLAVADDEDASFDPDRPRGG